MKIKQTLVATLTAGAIALAMACGGDTNSPHRTTEEIKEFYDERRCTKAAKLVFFSNEIPESFGREEYDYLMRIWVMDEDETFEQLGRCYEWQGNY